MPDHHLNIVSFTVPYPPNYGGVIDVYHKLAALKKSGIKIHLHCFTYDRKPAPELENLCESVHYYHRKTGILSALSLKPYIVESRRSEELLKNLLKNDFPILYEGLHSCYYLGHPSLRNRKQYYRESNIEHQYYYNLFKAERNCKDKLYFLMASWKLFLFQGILRHADAMFVVSEADTKYLQKKFPGKKVMHLPSFHGNTFVKSRPGTGRYALYHGNLSVAENLHAVNYLVREVFSDLDIPFRIAGLNPPESLKKLVDQYRNITLKANPSGEEMEQIIQDAHVNILVTFQATGLKLKLLNTLYSGRFVLVNPPMLAGTGLEDLCHTASDALSMKASLIHLFQQEFDDKKIAERELLLRHAYFDEENARKMIKEIFPDDRNV